MNFTILGSGGATPTPRIGCQCENCSSARIDPKLKRNHSSLFLEESNILIDCPEDIGDSLYKNNIASIEHLFLTHWHPDHTFGLRIILESTFDFYLHEVVKPITLHLPRRVHEDLKKYYPTIVYLIDTNKLAKVEYIEHGESIQIDDIRVTAVGFSREESHTYSFLFETNKKKCMYAPCDTFGLIPEVVEAYFKDLDVLIHECGIHSPEVKTEVLFPDLIERLRFCKPRRTILTHIEEIEVKRWGLPYFQELLKKYSDVPFEYAYDGLSIIL